MAVLGVETTSGDFEVIDICFAGMPELIMPVAGSSSSVANGIPNGKGKEKAMEAASDTNGERSASLLNIVLMDLQANTTHQKMKHGSLWYRAYQSVRKKLLRT